MSVGTKSKSVAVRERLNHPVIDGDGHIVEILPVLHEYMREIGGDKLFERYTASLPAGRLTLDGGLERVGGPRGWHGLTRQQRRDRRVSRYGFWAYPTGSALDRATVMLPNLYRERIDQLGIDYAVIYGTVGLFFLQNPDEEIRRVGCRAFNTMCADLFGPHADRMTVAALIPMHNPDEAVDELEHAITTLGLKTTVLGTCVRRPIVEVARRAPEVSSFATWMDLIALSSEYNYDPVWKKCVDLKVAVTVHTGSMGWASRAMPDNFCHNHIGHFAAANEAFCKALVIGGVAQRFPTLRFAFLEGGVGWACSLYNDLIEHWEKRNIKAMYQYLDPAKLDADEMEKLFNQYGGKLIEDKIGKAGRTWFGTTLGQEDPADLDDFTQLPIDNPRRFADYFRNFYFGCEADDRMTAVAFNPKINHYGAKMQAIFSSDVGHFDVRDITATVSEAYELVEEGLLSDEDFRDFTFANSVRLHASTNPDFFNGTAVEDAARKIVVAK